MSTAVQSKSSRIRELNDAFRTTFAGGSVMVTAGVDALPADLKARVLQCVRAFKDFDQGNDPHHEHDFGAFEVDELRFFFKIDYYDLSMRSGSNDPSDPAKTTRVLTIIRVEEY